jgi:hypothetical protein
VDLQFHRPAVLSGPDTSAALDVFIQIPDAGRHGPRVRHKESEGTSAGARSESFLSSTLAESLSCWQVVTRPGDGKVGMNKTSDWQNGVMPTG